MNTTHSNEHHESESHAERLSRLCDTVGRLKIVLQRSQQIYMLCERYRGAFRAETPPEAISRMKAASIVVQRLGHVLGIIDELFDNPTPESLDQIERLLARRFTAQFGKLTMSDSLAGVFYAPQVTISSSAELLHETLISALSCFPDVHRRTYKIPPVPRQRKKSFFKMLSIS